MRDITSGFQTEIESSSLRPCILVKAEFDSGNVLLWSGLDKIDYNSETYSGAGSLLSISPIEETQSLRSNNVTFELSGIPASLVALALTENYQGRPIAAWFGMLDATGLIASPYQIFAGQMDIMDMEDSGDRSSIFVSCESEAIEIRQIKERRYTPEDQAIDYPDDKGFEFVPNIQDRQVTWGAGRTD